MEAAQIYSSMFSGSSSEFKDFLFYSWDDKYGDNDFWLEKQNDPIWTQYRNDSDIIWTTDDYMAAVAIYNDVYFGDYYHDVVNGTTNVPTDNTELIAYSDWSNNAGISFDGVSVNASYGSNGGGASFSISFSFPVVLDLDGDGVELTSVIDSKAWFDITGDGTMHQTGWVGADDGLLSCDENGDGKITTAREIAFADRTVADDTDLEALKTEFDSNNDGKLDAGDNEFGKFYIWQDKNSDGESDDGELLTLPQAGISSMDLIGSKIDPYMVDGNKINAFTTYIRTDGTVGMGADVVYRNDLGSFKVSGDPIRDKLGNSYIVVDISSPFISNGFSGALLQNTQTGQYVVAFAGTNPASPNDMITNGSMFAHNVQNGVPDQFTSAGIFLNQMISEYGLNASNTTIVGHSEGGSEAMYFGSNLGFTTYTYNAYGIGNMDGLGTFTSNIHNYVTYLDFVSRLPGSVMIGTITMVGDTTFANMAGHGITNFLDPNIWTTNVVNGITDMQNFGFWHDMGITVENAGKILTNLSDYLHLNDASGLTDEQLFNAVLMASVDGSYMIEGTNGEIIKLAYNGDDIGRFLTATTTSLDGSSDSSSYFFNENGDFIGNIRSFDPQGTLVNSIGNDGTSALLEQFQNILTDDALMVSGIYTSSYAYDDSIFSDYLFYTQDDGYNINWLELANGANGIDISMGNYDELLAA